MRLHPKPVVDYFAALVYLLLPFFSNSEPLNRLFFPLKLVAPFTCAPPKEAIIETGRLLLGCRASVFIICRFLPLGTGKLQNEDLEQKPTCHPI